MLLQNILQLCKVRKTSIARLEKEIGLGNGTISRWGTSSPTVENVRKVAEFFGVTVDQLINDQAEN